MQNSKSPFSFDLGTPEYGWLSVNLRTKDLNLAFESSDVPANPIEQLISSLILLCNGVTEPPTVSWHLEPSYYHFNFRETNDLIILEISTSEQATPKQELTGTFTEIVYPIYRELRKFGAAEHLEQHWPSIPQTRFDQLKEVVKKRT